VDLLRRLDRHDPDAGLSDAERAALALVDAVACGGSGEALAAVRRHCSERATADHHLFADDHT
jgi:hypothetical protein